ncbi:hypothetical protein RGUI_1242 [Rhodovulum sp. P5]|nr:hypothetical protein RGUI_1242 [Rhodovulum sp. P5]
MGERRVGDVVTLPVSIAYQDLPRNSRIYAHLIAVAGDAWVTEGGGTMRADAPAVTFGGNLASGTRGLWQFPDINFPASVLIKRETLAQAFAKALGSAEAGDSFADTLSNEEDGLRLVFAYLANGSVQPGQSDARLEFTIPDYPHYFDAVVISPFLMIFKEDGSQTVSFNGKTMTSLRIPVRPHRPAPAQKPDQGTRHPVIPGTIAILDDASLNTQVRVGQSKTLELSVRYRDVMPGTAIYVVPVAMSGGKMVGTKDGWTTSFDAGGLSLTSKVAFIEGPSPIYAIPDDDKPIALSAVGGVQMEGALVSVVQDSTGVATGVVSFRPPPFLVDYDWVRLIPVLVAPTDKGTRVALDTKRFTGIDVAVSR